MIDETLPAYGKLLRLRVFPDAVQRAAVQR